MFLSPVAINIGKTMFNDNPNGFEDLDFQIQVYCRFRDSESYTVASVAEKMKIAEDTLRRYINGRSLIPADRVPDLVNATGDSFFIQELCNACGYFPIKKIDHIEAKKEGIADLILNVLTAVLDAANIIRFGKSELTKTEQKEIHNKLFYAIGCLFEIEERVKKSQEKEKS
jgi:transcriptional regulator with XRE-family HTH domain